MPTPYRGRYDRFPNPAFPVPAGHQPSTVHAASRARYDRLPNPAFRPSASAQYDICHPGVGTTALPRLSFRCPGPSGISARGSHGLLSRTSHRFPISPCGARPSRGGQAACLGPRSVPHPFWEAPHEEEPAPAIHLWRCICLSILTLQGVETVSAESASTATSPSPGKVMGLEKVIAFYGAYPELASQTFTRGGDWKYWKARGGIVSEGVVHYNFLGKSVDEASDVLANMDFGDNPRPVINIDEFGWDYDGGIDRHTAAILHGRAREEAGAGDHGLADAGPGGAGTGGGLPADGRPRPAGDLLRPERRVDDPLSASGRASRRPPRQVRGGPGAGQGGHGQGRLPLDPDGGGTGPAGPPDPLRRARVAGRGVLRQVEAEGEQLPPDRRATRRDLRPLPGDAHRRQRPHARAA